MVLVRRRDREQVTTTPNVNVLLALQENHEIEINFRDKK